MHTVVLCILPQLSLWTFLAPRCDVKGEIAKLCVEPPPVLRLWYKYPSKPFGKGAEKQCFSPFFHGGSVYIYYIVNRGIGGELPQNCASFSYPSILGATGIQRLNSPKAFIGCQDAQYYAHHSICSWPHRTLQLSCFLYVWWPESWPRPTISRKPCGP